jgi:GT2 family glycosyltransferase
MAETPEVSVLVLGMNSLQHLGKCISSMLSQEGTSFEVIYIDNASSDGSSDFVRKNFPKVKVAQNTANSGYTGGNNFGAKNASGKYLLIVNPDTIAQKGWLSSLYHFLKEKEKSGEDAIACSKVVLAQNPQTVNSLGVFVSCLGFSGSIGDGQMQEKFTEPLAVFAPSGCSFMIRKELFLSMGGFDESLFMYGEDADLGWRAGNRGIKSYCVPSSVIWHNYSKFKGRPMPYYQTLRNQILIIRKNEKGLRMILLGKAAFLFAMVFSFANLLLLRPAIFSVGMRGAFAGIARNVEKDSFAGGPARVLGISESLRIARQKLFKHL